MAWLRSSSKLKFQRSFFPLGRAEFSPSGPSSERVGKKPAGDFSGGRRGTAAARCWRRWRTAWGPWSPTSRADPRPRSFCDPPRKQRGRRKTAKALGKKPPVEERERKKERTTGIGFSGEAIQQQPRAREATNVSRGWPRFLSKAKLRPRRGNSPSAQALHMSELVVSSAYRAVSEGGWPTVLVFGTRASSNSPRRFHHYIAFDDPLDQILHARGFRV